MWPIVPANFKDDLGLGFWLELPTRESCFGREEGRGGKGVGIYWCRTAGGETRSGKGETKAEGDLVKYRGGLVKHRVGIDKIL